MSKPPTGDDAEANPPEDLEDADPNWFIKGQWRYLFEDALRRREAKLQLAVESLLNEVGGYPSEVTVERWVSLLDNPDPGVRASAAREFGPELNSSPLSLRHTLIGIRPKDVAIAALALCRLVESTRDGVTTTAALESLGRFGLDAALSAVPALIKFIEDKRPGPKEAAITSLQHFGPDSASEAVPALIAALDDQSVEIRLAACRTLAWLGGQAAEAEDAIELLVAMAGEDEDSKVRREATRALVKIDPKGKQIAKAIPGEEQRLRFLSMLRSLTEDQGARRLRQKLRSAWKAGGRTRSGAAGEGGRSDPPEGEPRRDANPVDPPAMNEIVRPIPHSTSTLVDRFSDIGVGIHNKEFYLFGRCPGAGEEVLLRDGKKLDLRGSGRWPKVLDVFARSVDGKTASRSELIAALGYRKAAGIPLERKLAADVEGLHEKVGRVTRQLCNTMSDLSLKQARFGTRAA